MRIDTLRIKNFKGIADLELNFPEQFTVLIGDNGTGKTAILDALAVAAGSYLLGIDQVNVRSRPIYKEDIRRIDLSSVERGVEQLPVIIEAQGVVHQQAITWKRELLKSSAKTTTKGAKAISNIAAKSQLIAKQAISQWGVDLPILAYHGTGRLWAEHKEKVEFKKQGSRLEGYIDCLSPKSSGKIFRSWYKTFETEVRELANPEISRMLDTFKSTLTEIVHEWQEISYSYVDDDLVGYYQKSDGEFVKLPFRMLSDGYRNMIGMVADIAYRCIKLNPNLGDKAVKKASGIVLIDEIDLHLHPKWQKLIVNDLKRVFPNIQFIVTTHSPFIVQSLRHEELLNLEPEKDHNDNDPFVMSLEDISEQEMDVQQPNRSEKFQEMEKLAAQYFDLIEQGQSNENVDQIKQQLDIIELEFSKDPAYVALMRAERASQAVRL